MLDVSYTVSHSNILTLGILRCPMEEIYNTYRQFPKNPTKICRAGISNAAPAPGNSTPRRLFSRAVTSLGGTTLPLHRREDAWLAPCAFLPVVASVPILFLSFFFGSTQLVQILLCFEIEFSAGVHKE